MLQIRDGIDAMEKGATIGMLALSCSDLFFCMTTIADTLTKQVDTYYFKRNMSFYIMVYGNYFQNLFIKTSTWFTVILAIGRFLVVCYPMKARRYRRPWHTSMAILISALTWMILLSPLLWTWSVKHRTCNDTDILVLDMGIFLTAMSLKKSASIVWGVLGFFIPVFILAYCNIRLIHALHRSRRMRQVKQITARSGLHDRHQKINITLICIVLMFFLCNFPSEVLNFSLSISSPHVAKFGVVICNFLQAINYSCTFALYCVMNSYFRKTLMAFMLPCHPHRYIMRKNTTYENNECRLRTIPNRSFSACTSDRRVMNRLTENNTRLCTPSRENHPDALF